MPDCIAVAVVRPITPLGACRSTRYSLEACENSASAEILIPGAMTPPTYSPVSLMMSKVVAVPKSTTTTGGPYRAIAAIALTIRSAPTSLGLS
jgi:hypothetical protein